MIMFYFGFFFIFKNREERQNWTAVFDIVVVPPDTVNLPASQSVSSGCPSCIENLFVIQGKFSLTVRNKLCVALECG
jgi:hypothetical protein